jgi:5-methyltetrahydrofolate--homocysteine methyltransferase
MNCSLGPKALSAVAREYLKYASVPVILKPNAGLPKAVDGKTVFDVLPEEFSKEVASLIREGVRIVGGCCGTTPEYISKTVEVSGGIKPVEIEKKNITAVSSYTHAVTFGNAPVLIGERINPTGKKRFKEALRAHDMDYILKEGIEEQEKGVHILDVNVGLPEIDETEMLCSAVTGLQMAFAYVGSTLSPLLFKLLLPVEALGWWLFALSFLSFLFTWLLWSFKRKGTNTKVKA